MNLTHKQRYLRLFAGQPVDRAPFYLIMGPSEQALDRWVTEGLEDERRLRALSLWVQDKHVGEYVYDVAGTPCEPVINNRKLIHVPDRLISCRSRCHRPQTATSRRWLKTERQTTRATEQ